MHVLEQSAGILRAHLLAGLPYPWRIVIVSNGSTDGADHLGRALSARHADVELLSLAKPGRGRALRHAWMRSSASAVCHMDVDLSTDLSFLQPLIEAVLEHGYDVAAGSRPRPGARTNRCFRCETISHIYNRIVRFAVRTGVRDSQCGFKAASRRAVELVVPQVSGPSWFLGAELLVLARASGLRVQEIPVVWHEDPDSRVRIVSTAVDDLKGIVRVWRSLRAQRRGAPASAAAERTRGCVSMGEES